MQLKIVINNFIKMFFLSLHQEDNNILIEVDSIMIKSSLFSCA